jgi:enterochelin esterase-like enzyme
MSEPLSAPSPALGEHIGGFVVRPEVEPRGVVYLLHGRGGEAADWLPVIAELRPPLVAVLPDAPWNERSSWYVDSRADGGHAVETAIARDLVAHVDALYPELATRDRRLIGGISMGGAGALRLALAHPGVFGSLLALSPAIFLPPPPRDSTTRMHGAFGRGATRFDAATYRALHYRNLLATAPGLRAFVAAGTAGDLTHEAEVVADDLRRAGAEVTTRFYVGGHEWETWTPALRDGLAALR